MSPRTWLALLGCALLVGGYAAWTWRGWARERRALAAAAADLAARTTAERAATRGGWLVRGTLEGRPFEVRLGLRLQIRDDIDPGPQFVPGARLVVPVQSPAQLELRYVGRDFRNELRRMSAEARGRRVPTGDAAFNARFAVFAADPGAIVCLSPALRARLLTLEPGFASYRWRVEVAGGHATWVERFVRHDRGVGPGDLSPLILDRLRLLGELARACEGAPGAGAPAGR